MSKIMVRRKFASFLDACTWLSLPDNKYCYIRKGSIGPIVSWYRGDLIDLLGSWEDMRKVVEAELVTKTVWVYIYPDKVVTSDYFHKIGNDVLKRLCIETKYYIDDDGQHIVVKQ